MKFIHMELYLNWSFHTSRTLEEPPPTSAIRLATITPEDKKGRNLQEMPLEYRAIYWTTESIILQHKSFIFSSLFGCFDI
ncbi:hypothetical protein Hanom_Chr15g01398861 [Helianthus anomalus]